MGRKIAEVDVDGREAWWAPEASAIDGFLPAFERRRSFSSASTRRARFSRVQGAALGKQAKPLEWCVAAWAVACEGGLTSPLRRGSAIMVQGSGAASRAEPDEQTVRRRRLLLVRVRGRVRLGLGLGLGLGRN